MNRDDVIRMAREAAEAGSWKPGLGNESVAEFMERFAALVAAAERRKHQADIEAWKAEAATAEKWRGMALAKDTMQPGKVVQEIQREAAQAALVAQKDDLYRSRIGAPCSHCGVGRYRACGNGYNDFHRCDKCRYVPMWNEDGTEFGVSTAPKAKPACWCETCRPITLADMRMVLCPQCGNKRCPRATHHDNACTDSNAPGQKGSSWENVRQATAHADNERDHADEDASLAAGRLQAGLAGRVA